MNAKLFPLCLIAIMASAARAAEPKVVTIDRANRTIEGWTVRVDKSLLDGPDAELGTTALWVLAHKLSEIKLLVPKDRLAKLQRVTIVLDAHHPLKSMQYHPGVGWLKEHGYEPSLVKSVHIPRAAALAGRMPVNQQPMVVLHELAHAYHDQVLGFDEPRIKAAWKSFQKSGKYEDVLHIAGGHRRHYALTNQMEFFAEMTESFFGTNDFYPFVRGELKRELPDVHKLLAEVWGVAP